MVSLAIPNLKIIWDTSHVECQGGGSRKPGTPGHFDTARSLQKTHDSISSDRPSAYLTCWLTGPQALLLDTSLAVAKILMIPVIRKILLLVLLTSSSPAVTPKSLVAVMISRKSPCPSILLTF